MAGIGIRPITPKRPLFDVRQIERLTEAETHEWAEDTVKELATYPPALPWKSRPPKGVRRPRRSAKNPMIGRRTGTLGRGWRIGGTARRPTVYNDVDYAGFVEGFTSGLKGERQTRVMAERGWPRIDEVGRTQWAKHVPKVRLILASRGYR